MKSDDDVNAKLKYILSRLSPWGKFYMGSVLRSPGRLPKEEYDKLVDRIYREMKDKENNDSSINDRNKMATKA